MIRYNTRDWFGTTFRFHRADTFIKLLPLILVVAVYSGVVASASKTHPSLTRTVCSSKSLSSFMLSLFPSDSC